MVVSVTTSALRVVEPSAIAKHVQATSTNSHDSVWLAACPRAEAAGFSFERRIGPGFEYFARFSA
jgi:hypothetical protein